MMARNAIVGLVAACFLACAATAAEDAPALGELPKQQLPTHGCAAYLWTKGPANTLVAMVGADPAQIRLNLDGTVRDIARAEQSGTAGLGFDSHVVYRSADATVTLDMTVETQADVKQGGVVSAGSLTIERPGKDVMIVPVGGLVGCAAANQGGT